MFSASITVRNNKIPAKIRAVKAATATATWLGAQAVLAEARRRVRVGKTRELLDSLQIVGKEGDARVQVGSVGAHGGRPVARFIENGTVKMHAAPFMRPGAAMGRKTLKAEAEARIRAAAEAT
jgi:HK97 gp10 family phage protein